MSKDAKFKGRIKSGWSGKSPEGQFQITVGPMASGASVLANRSVLGEISGTNRDLVVIEMEAYAVMAAAEYSVAPSPIAMTIEWACDFADADKSDDWQQYAAYTSCAFFDELVKSGRLR